MTGQDISQKQYNYDLKLDIIKSSNNKSFFHLTTHIVKEWFQNHRPQKSPKYRFKCCGCGYTIEDKKVVWALHTHILNTPICVYCKGIFRYEQF